MSTVSLTSSNDEAAPERDGASEALSQDVLAHLLQIPGPTLVADAASGRVHGTADAATVVGRPLPSTLTLDNHVEWLGLRTHGRLLDSAMTPLARAIRGESSHDEVLSLDRPDGSTLVVRSHARPLRSASGRIVGATQLLAEALPATLAPRALREMRAAAIALDAAATREQILDVTLKRTAGVLGAQTGGIALLDEARTTLQMVATFGHPARLTDAYRTVSLDSELPIAEVVRTGVPVYLDSRAKWQPTDGSPEPTPSRSLAALPLSIGRDVVGAIGFSFDGAQRFDDEARVFMEGMARECGRALQREQHDRALRRSEEQYRAFITATSDVVFRLSPDWREVHLLQGRDFRPEPDGASRPWIERYIPPEDRPRVLDAIAAAARRGTAFEVEHRVQRADGSIGWTFSRAVPLYDDEGRVIEWLGTARDISERVEALTELAQLTTQSDQQRRLYETILGATPDFVYVFDRNHRFTYANPALLTMWGRTWEEAIGRTCLELGYPDWHAAMHDREIEEVIATGRPIRGEVPFAGTTGRRMYDYIFVPVFGQDGQVEAVAGTTRDVTERTEAEATLRDREQRLAEANRVKDEFLATLSHELRTPLNAVLGWAHILRSGPLPQQVEERALDALERNARAQARLVEELLDVSRIMSGKLVVRTDPVDLRTVMIDAADAVRPAARAKRQTLIVAPTDGPVTVIGDAQRLQQIVWNLLANAVKFTPDEGQIEAVLSVHAGVAIVEVRDTGEGIPAAFLPRVFERFQQADSAPTRRHGGLGLGLALVRHLTEAHGGTAAVESEGEGRGATFRVRIPLATA